MICFMLNIDQGRFECFDSNTNVENCFKRVFYWNEAGCAE